MNSLSEIHAPAIEGDPVAGAIVETIKRDFQSGWKGCAIRLYALLEAKVDRNTRHSHAWPDGVITFRSRLECLRPLLRQNGIVVETWHGGDWFITIRPATPSARDD